MMGWRLGHQANSPYIIDAELLTYEWERAGEDGVHLDRTLKDMLCISTNGVELGALAEGVRWPVHRRQKGAPSR